MGFYSPATVVKDAQRHGLKVRPIDVTCSDYLCTLERSTQQKSMLEEDAPGKAGEELAVRLGLRYVGGLRADPAQEIVRERGLRPFTSIDGLKYRVPSLQKSELTALAEIGALNFLGGQRSHRRAALWQVERAARRAGPLLESFAASESITHINAHSRSTSVIQSGEDTPVSLLFPAAHSPLAAMTAEERLIADFRVAGMTTGPHPMAYHRSQLTRQGVSAAFELASLPNGAHVRIAGAVIARQRPGTAKGFVFLSIEDETGIANAILTPQVFERDHLMVVHQPFLWIEGNLQNQENTISVKATRVRPFALTRVSSPSHDFH